MQVGDLVYKISDWAQANSWMTDTELDNTDKTSLGIIVKVSTNEWLAVVSWPDKGNDTTETIGSLRKFKADKK